MLTAGIAMLLAAVPQATVSSPEEPWTREQMTADLGQLVEAVREKWSYLEDRTANNGLDLDALHARSLAALDEVHSRADFADILRRFISTLEDGHGSARVECGELPRKYLLLSLAACAEGAVVVSSDEQAAVDPAARRPQPGDLLIAIDGRPVTELLAEREPLTTGSTPGHRRANTFKTLTYTIAEEVSVVTEDLLGQRHEVLLRSRGWPVMPERHNWVLTWPAEGVAMLRIESFAVKDWAAWLEAAHEDREPFLVATFERIAEIFEELDAAGATALIIDVRGNGGGTDALGIQLAKHLIHEPFSYFLLAAMGEDGWREPGGLTYETEEGMTPFHGPVLALIDHRCFSTTDNFLRCLRDLHPRFTAVGRATGAGTGAPRDIATLEHSGARIRLCTMRVLGPQSGLTEGRGTQPDLPVTWTRADIVGERDPDLEAALRALRE